MERFTSVEIFRKKEIPFEVLPFSPFLPKRLKFSVPFVWITSARLHVERKRKFYRSCFRCQKKYQYHLTEIFHRHFGTNGKRSKFLSKYQTLTNDIRGNIIIDTEYSCNFLIQ